MSQGEFEVIDELRRRFSREDSAGAVQVGIGDDAAVLAGDGRSLVVSVDAQVEDVHFTRTWLDEETIGHRAFVAAVSDLAAMGAEPIAALSSLVVPAATADVVVRGVTTGQAAAAHAYACPMIGGNLARGPSLSITTTVLGRAERPLLRSGARVGDAVYVAGALGMAAAGLAAYQRDVHGPSVDAARRAWAVPVARIREGIAAAAWASSAIDLSDGLVQDAGHVAQASGVAIDLRRAFLEPFIAALADAARALEADAWDWLLYGGEDYSLLVTGLEPSSPGFTCIGHVVAGAGVTLEGAELPARGHDHFGAQPRG